MTCQNVHYLMLAQTYSVLHMVRLRTPNPSPPASLSQQAQEQEIRSRLRKNRRVLIFECPVNSLKSSQENTCPNLRPCFPHEREFIAQPPLVYVLQQAKCLANPFKTWKNLCILIPAPSFVSARFVFCTRLSKSIHACSYLCSFFAQGGETPFGLKIRGHSTRDVTSQKMKL